MKFIKTVLLTAVVVLVLFLQLVELGELKKLQQQQQDQSPPRKKETRNDVEQLRASVELLDRCAEIAKDPSRSGAAAVLYAGELSKNLSPDLAIAYYTNLLPDIRDPAVRRAIRFQLVELHLRGPTPDREKALEQLRMLMTGNEGAPGEGGAGMTAPTSRPGAG